MFKSAFFLFAAVVLLANCQKIEDDLKLSSEEKAAVARIEQDCLAESNASLDEVHKFDKGEFADNKPLRCFYKCLLTRFGVMDVHGRIQHNKINLLVPDNLRSKAEHCFNREKDEPCDVAYETYKCYIKSIYL